MGQLDEGCLFIFVLMVIVLGLWSVGVGDYRLSVVWWWGGLWGYTAEMVVFLASWIERVLFQVMIFCVSSVWKFMNSDDGSDNDCMRVLDSLSSSICD